MRFLGCLGLLMVVGVVTAEVYSFVVASHLLRTYAREIIGGAAVMDTILPLILVQVTLMAIGVVVVKRAFTRMPTALMGSVMGQNADAGRVMLSMLGGILLIIPGFFLDVIAIIVLLPPVQALLAKIGQRVVMALVRRQLGKMFPGGMPPGGMAGGFPGGFPGMQPRGSLTPDERIPRRPGKVIDTTAERVDR